MTEKEAAKRLCALLNEIQAAGHRVEVTSNFGSGYYLAVGLEASVDEPVFDDGEWTVAG